MQEAGGEDVAGADPVYDLQIPVLPTLAKPLADADESAQVVPIPLMHGAFSAGDES